VVRLFARGSSFCIAGPLSLFVSISTFLVHSLSLSLVP
jgi:hypothetical protein